MLNPIASGGNNYSLGLSYCQHIRSCQRARLWLSVNAFVGWSNKQTSKVCGLQDGLKPRNACFCIQKSVSNLPFIEHVLWSLPRWQKIQLSNFFWPPLAKLYIFLRSVAGVGAWARGTEPGWLTPQKFGPASLGPGALCSDLGKAL